jgi:hypothetical protein
MDDQKDLMVKSVSTLCTSRSHMARAKARRTRITASQSKLLPSRRKRIKRKMRVASCAVFLIIGQRSVQAAKEEILNLSGTKHQHTSTRDETNEYTNLPSILSVFQSTTLWLNFGANVHVFSDVSLFSSYQVARDLSMMIENESHAFVYGVGMTDMKLTLRKIM